MIRRLLLLSMLALPLPLGAQSPARRPLAILGGVGLQFGEENYGPGVHLGGRFTAYARSWFAVRIDASYDTFGTIGTYNVAPCPGSCAIPTGDRIKMLSTNASIRLGAPSNPAWVLGFGVYGAVETPSDGSYVRPGWNVGFTTSMNPPVFFEMRLHGLLGQQNTRSFAVLALGVWL